MANIELRFSSEEIVEGQEAAVAAAVSTILTNTCWKQTSYTPAPADFAAAVEEKIFAEPAAVPTTVSTGSGLAPVEPAPAVEEKPAKPKRKRRTKAQIAADKAAKAAEFEEVAALEPEVVEVDPLADAEEYNELDVKAAVVAEVERLTEAGYESPTRAVVEKLVVLTGKQKVSEIDSSLYGKVIAGLSAA